MSARCVACGWTSHFYDKDATKFFRFPSKLMYPEKRDAWVAAVRRVHPDGSLWEPSGDCQICSAHFITGRPSNFKNRPDFVPTVFNYARAPGEASVQLPDPFVKRQEGDRAAPVGDTNFQFKATKDIWFKCCFYTTSACAKVFAETSRVAGENRTLVLGDFNAHNTIWGYDRDTPKGREIANQAELHEAFLLNEVADYTRIGNSAQKDTNPDLTFGINIDDYTWLNTCENLGSDHFVIETRVPLPGYKSAKFPTQKCTDWDKFRQKRKDRPLHTIEEWCAQLVEDHESVTTEVENPTQARTMDSKLQHMLEAYRSKYRRWRNTGKRYRKLRKKSGQAQ
ncbi:uncharacterized protein ISCGN_011555 [Ixodes scapularis]